MHLLSTRTLELEQFPADAIPEYAILSHTWEQEEISYRDIQDLRSAKTKDGYKKIQGACRLASWKGFAHIWIDTCCIDKSSSAELQEAIDSMYRWYAEAKMCVVYMSDVNNRGLLQLDDELVGAVFHYKWEVKDAFESHGKLDLHHLAHAFWHSTWFKRGWTLQELIAPQEMEFFDKGWNLIARRSELIRYLSSITRVEAAVLTHTKRISSISIAKRMSWAAGRKTTRVEDRAYSLLGIFPVNMPMLYGEGQRAFTRLQEEIMRTSTDHSIFAWNGSSHGELLARSPDDFAAGRSTVVWGKPSAFEMTNQGLRISLPVIKRQRWSGYEEHLAILNCREEFAFDRSLAMRLRKYRQSDEYYALHGDEYRRGEDRLESVRVRDFADCGKASLHISRHFAPVSIGVKFRLFINHYHITDAYSTHGMWDPKGEILDTGPQMYVRAAVIVVLPLSRSQQRFFVAFGFDSDGLGDRSEFAGAPQSCYTLRIRALRGTFPFTDSDFARHSSYSTSCQHSQFPCGICSTTGHDKHSAWNEDIPADFQHEVHPVGENPEPKCAFTSDPFHILEDELIATISEQEMMGETVFTVNISKSSRTGHDHCHKADGTHELDGPAPDNVPEDESTASEGNGI